MASEEVKTMRDGDESADSCKGSSYRELFNGFNEFEFTNVRNFIIFNISQIFC